MMSDGSLSPLSTPSPSSSATLATSPFMNGDLCRSAHFHSYSAHPCPQKTTGESFGCIVNASVTVVPDPSDPLKPPQYVYVFGGFHQYTDDVYNDLYRLNVAEMRWEDVIYIKGNRPSKRNDHSASLWNGDKLIIFGGTDEQDVNCNDVIVLDLRTMTWERPEVHGAIPQGRAKHSATIYNDRLYVVGGYQQTCEHAFSDVCVLDLQTWTWEPPIQFVPRHSHFSFVYRNRLYMYGGFTEDMDREESLTMLNLETRRISTIHGDQAPQMNGQVHAQLCGDQLIVVVTQSVKHGVQDASAGIWSLDLQSFEWQEFEGGAQMVSGNWHYFAMAVHAARFFLFGDEKDDEYFSNVLAVDLQEYGLVHAPAPTIAADFGRLFDDATTSDFVIATGDEDDPPIHCHRTVLLARWPHFAKMVNSGMTESFGTSITIPEPYSTVRAFLHYLYTDSLNEYIPMDTVADLMVLGNMYLLPRLTSLCCNRLHQKIDIENVARVYHRACVAEENGLKKRSARFIDHHFGRVSKTQGFRTLPKEVLFDFLDSLPEKAKISLE